MNRIADGFICVFFIKACDPSQGAGKDIAEKPLTYGIGMEKHWCATKSWMATLRDSSVRLRGDSDSCKKGRSLANLLIIS